MCMRIWCFGECVPGTNGVERSRFSGYSMVAALSMHKRMRFAVCSGKIPVFPSFHPQTFYPSLVRLIIDVYHIIIHPAFITHELIRSWTNTNLHTHSRCLHFGPVGSVGAVAPSPVSSAVCSIPERPRSFKVMLDQAQRFEKVLVLVRSPKINHRRPPIGICKGCLAFADIWKKLQWSSFWACPCLRMHRQFRQCCHQLSQCTLSSWMLHFPH